MAGWTEEYCKSMDPNGSLRAGQLYQALGHVQFEFQIWNMLTQSPQLNLLCSRSNPGMIADSTRLKRMLQAGWLGDWSVALSR